MKTDDDRGWEKEIHVPRFQKDVVKPNGAHALADPWRPTQPEPPKWTDEIVKKDS